LHRTLDRLGRDTELPKRGDYVIAILGSMEGHAANDLALSFLSCACCSVDRGLGRRPARVAQKALRSPRAWRPDRRLREDRPMSSATPLSGALSPRSVGL